MTTHTATPASSETAAAVAAGKYRVGTATDAAHNPNIIRTAPAVERRVVELVGPDSTDRVDVYLDGELLLRGLTRLERAVLVARLVTADYPGL